MSNEQEFQSTLINVKAVTEAKDYRTNKNGVSEDRVMIGFGPTLSDGKEVDGVAMLIETLQQYVGKQVNLDFRISTKKSERGTEYRTAYVLVKERIPGQPRRGYGPRAGGNNVKSKADEIRKSFGG